VDVFAVSTYATVSLLFWYVGLMPDLATLRDRAGNKIARLIYAVGALGWRGSARHWSVYETASLLLAGIATPLVLSVHTVVSFDFTIAIVPGWHSTFFPPYFVAGAIYSGFAMVLALAIPLRSVYGLKGLITDKHLDNSAKVNAGHGVDRGLRLHSGAFTGWYSGNVYEHAVTVNRMTGPYALQYWTLVLCNIVAPNFLWIKKFPLDALAALRLEPDRAGGYVAGALRDHRQQPGAGQPGVVVARISGHAMGLGNVPGHHRPVPVPVLPVHPGCCP